MEATAYTTPAPSSASKRYAARSRRVSVLPSFQEYSVSEMLAELHATELLAWQRRRSNRWKGKSAS